VSSCPVLIWGPGQDLGACAPPLPQHRTATDRGECCWSEAKEVLAGLGRLSSLFGAAQSQQLGEHAVACLGEAAGSVGSVVAQPWTARGAVFVLLASTQSDLLHDAHQQVVDLVIEYRRHLRVLAPVLVRQRLPLCSPSHSTAGT